MAAKLIDLSFTLNGRKVKVQIAPDTMLFALLREQGCSSVRCACETTNCGLCTVWLDGDPVLSCSVPAARVEGHTITTLEGLKAESEALARAMAAEGAEQCGFCAPRPHHERAGACPRRQGGPEPRRHARGALAPARRQPLPLQRLREPAARRCPLSQRVRRSGGL